MLDIDTRTPEDREDERLGFCVCDFPTCETCDPEPDPDAVEYHRLIALGLTPTQAAAEIDAGYLTEAEWLAMYA